MTEKYRFDQQTGTLYEFDYNQNAYVFVANANGKTESETIADYEESLHEEVTDF